jgi:integrase
MFALGEPKTEKSRRTLALPAAAVAVLKAHRASEVERQLAAPVWLNQWNLVFTGDQGVPLSDRAVRYAFQDLLEQAGITGRRVRLHDLRHGAATYMLAQCVPMKVVQEVLGHSQMSITSDTYSHVLPELQREAADRLGDVLFGGSAG